jgi:hypothetical protein
MEIEIPAHACLPGRSHEIFWDCSVFGCLGKFESAALQAVVFLQGVYGYVAVDYSCYGTLAHIGTASLSDAASVSFHGTPRWDDLHEELKCDHPCVLSLGLFTIVWVACLPNFRLTTGVYAFGCTSVFFFRLYICVLFSIHIVMLPGSLARQLLS